jgi:drug/metabolite transporter (DMT)-like permease
MDLLGLAAAVAAAAAFNVGVALQALEARKAPRRLALSVGLLGHLLQRPLWLAGTALQLLGVVPQVVALAYAPFAVVQTVLAGGLAILLFIGVRYLGERVDRAAAAGVGLLVAGVALVSIGAPGHSEAHRAALFVVPVVAFTALGAVSPVLLGRESGTWLAVAAGLGFAGTNIATKLASDDIGRSHWANAAAWGVTTAALGVWATITQMSAFQRTAATVVVPVSMAVQTFLPIVLEPLFLRERFTSFATHVLPTAGGVAVAVVGVVLIGRNRAVAELAAGR